MKVHVNTSVHIKNETTKTRVHLTFQQISERVLFDFWLCTLPLSWGGYTSGSVCCSNVFLQIYMDMDYAAERGITCLNQIWIKNEFLYIVLSAES